MPPSDSEHVSSWEYIELGADKFLPWRKIYRALGQEPYNFRWEEVDRMPEARAIFYLIDQRFIDAAGGDPSFGEKESQLQNRYNAQVNRWKEKRLAQYMEVLKR